MRLLPLLLLLSSASPLALPLPKSVKASVARAKDCTQAALGARLSRMLVDMPPGADFAVEPRGKAKDDPAKAVERSCRELGFLYRTMFEPLGEGSIAVVFDSDRLCEDARRQWGPGGPRELSMEGGGSAGKKKKGGGGKGFMQAMNDLEAPGPPPSFSLPDGVECALFVAPTAPRLPEIAALSDALGDGTLLILLNSYLTKDGALPLLAASPPLAAFEPVYSLTANDPKFGGVLQLHECEFREGWGGGKRRFDDDI
jgi:hypothetical protein